MSIKVIAAMNNQYGIGYKGDLLFHIKEDMKHFKELATGNSDSPNIIVIGRKTFESLPNPLPNRINVVLTKNKSYKAPVGVFVFDSVEQIINHYNSGDQDRDVFIIGGQSIYEAFIPYTDEVYLTYIDKKAELLDTYFPYKKMKEYFEVVNAERHYSEEEECEYSFITYRHK